MLLLLQGVGVQAPVVAGIRAYANTYYSAVFSGDAAFSVVNAGGNSITGVGDAAGAITTTSGATGDITPTTHGLPSEE